MNLALGLLSNRLRSILFAGFLFVFVVGAGGAQSNASHEAAWKLAHAPLMTRWAKLVTPENPLPEYPRPQMVRSAWMNLNGLWDYALADVQEVAPPSAFQGKILVPYPMESALSGLAKPSQPDHRLWYRRRFTVPAAWNGQHVLLHFGAVNWSSQVFLNGVQVGSHRGGYDPFEFDVTPMLHAGANEIVVSAWNPLLADNPTYQLLGKQRVHPAEIFYTASTGIWQTVWLEPVPAVHIRRFQVTPDIDKGELSVQVSLNGAVGNARVELRAADGKGFLEGSARAPAPGAAGAESTWTGIIKIPHPHLWSPTDPHLYRLAISLMGENSLQDRVDGYFAMRKVSIGPDASNRTRILLNNQPIFQVGVLDQGYWPDGIYTAPTDEALQFDIVAAKGFGFNLLRKHAKVEPDRWYYWADKLGMLVWQDVPQGFPGKNGVITDAARKQFDAEVQAEIQSHINHPSIIVWTPFNEGWGQHDTERIVSMIKQLDPSRLVDEASGSDDKGGGDLADTHAYPGPWSGPPEPMRAAVNGEFGGVTMRVPGHMWTEDVFGYGATLTSGWKVTKRYQDLLKSAFALRKQQGTSAFVYTQLTDVERESNGLLTYDRSVLKPDLAVLRAANSGLFLPLPPNPDPEIVPTSEDTAQMWQVSISRPQENWMKPDFESSGWTYAPAPFGHDIDGARTDWTTPDIWIRREVDLPESLPAKLSFLCFHDEDVEIYINGVLGALAPGYVTSYVRLPMNAPARAALHPGKNVIAVHCHQTTGGQFIDVGIVRAGG